MTTITDCAELQQEAFYAMAATESDPYATFLAADFILDRAMKHLAKRRTEGDKQARTIMAACIASRAMDTCEQMERFIFNRPTRVSSRSFRIPMTIAE